ncbi:MAG: hypothetical protein IKS55_09690 [Oscillospiraceae bacterium]|nr:hypothetical protein [Oscillospiraceae bacterium]
MKTLRLIACLVGIACMLACAAGISAFAEVKTFKYTQYASGGTPTELDAVILFENKNKTFTKYQVAYTSCTCRGPETNYSSVMYIELLNTKDTPEEASIRRISFGQVDNLTPGLWGDSSPIMGHPEYTAEYMDEHLVQPMVGATKAQFDSWEGYGSVIDAIDADAVSGATVSTSNMTSVIRELFQYHADKYYK